MLRCKTMNSLFETRLDERHTRNFPSFNYDDRSETPDSSEAKRSKKTRSKIYGRNTEKKV